MTMRLHTIPLALIVLALTGCDSGRDDGAGRQQEQTASAPAFREQDTRTNVMNIAIMGLEYMGPREIEAGWVTLRIGNSAPMVHFAIVERMPEGRGIADHQREVAPVFQEGMDLLSRGDPEGAAAKFGELPAWFGEIEFMGGTGLIAAGGSAQTTVFLEPGTYLLECYVKTGGVFHSYNPDENSYGMVHEFRVLDANSGAPEPTPTLEMTLSAERGFEVPDAITKGRHTMAVHFRDQQAHENFVGHDVHLARLAEDTDVEALESWMDWREPSGLSTPAPVQFLGGVSEMPAGATGYFTFDLTPGRYALIAEVPHVRAKGMYVEFDVTY